MAINETPDERLRLQYTEVLRRVDYHIGDKISVEGDLIKSEGRHEWLSGTVAGVYRHHILIDFGAYKECRRKADLYLGLC